MASKKNVAKIIREAFILNPKPRTFSELARELGVSYPSVQRAVKKLEVRGLVMVDRDEQRTVFPILTTLAVSQNELKCFKMSKNALMPANVGPASLCGENGAFPGKSVCRDLYIYYLDHDKPTKPNQPKKAEILSADKPEIFSTEKTGEILSADKPGVFPADKTREILSANKAEILSADKPEILSANKAEILSADKPGVFPADKAEILSADNPGVSPSVEDMVNFFALRQKYVSELPAGTICEMPKDPPAPPKYKPPSMPKSKTVYTSKRGWLHDLYYADDSAHVHYFGIPPFEKDLLFVQAYGRRLDKCPAAAKATALYRDAMDPDRARASRHWEHWQRARVIADLENAQYDDYCGALFYFYAGGTITYEDKEGERKKQEFPWPRQLYGPKARDYYLEYAAELLKGFRIDLSYLKRNQSQYLPEVFDATPEPTADQLLFFDKIMDEIRRYSVACGWIIDRTITKMIKAGLMSRRYAEHPKWNRICPGYEFGEERFSVR